jgi:glucosamine--fructose-6-phosphate aminotransferase (isomerizing)
VESLGNFPDPFIGAISGQPDAVRHAAARLDAQRGALEAVARLAGDREPPVLTGMGSSYYACHPAVAELADVGIPALHVDAAELLHFRTRILSGRGAIVIVSQSGESVEVVRLVETIGTIPLPPTVIAVTNGSDNTLAVRADVALDTGAGEEAGPSTRTFASSLVVLGALARVLGGAGPGDTVTRAGDDAALAARTIEELLADRDLAERLAALWDGRSRGVLLGRGPARAAAEMGALTIKEAAARPVESLQAAQFRHGPLELAGPDLAAFVFATEPETLALDLGLVEELADLGTAVIAVTAAPDASQAAMTVPLRRLDRTVAPAASIVPVQLLAWQLARLQGRAPGTFVHAAKVTTRE